MADRLKTDERLTRGQLLTSNNGHFRLWLQPDGNLVLYNGEPTLESAYWATGTWTLPEAQRPVYASMQSDAHFVLYDANDVPRWGSGTWGTGYTNPFLLLGDDGNLRVVDGDEQAVWASGKPNGSDAVPARGPTRKEATRRGRFRVTINGFRCETETWDDALEWDGKRDEVFLATAVTFVDRQGRELYKSTPRSPILGDTNNLPNRVQAGSASNKGGIRTGDVFPHQAPWVRQLPLLRERDYPPMAVWEGELAQGENGVFVTPTIWEWDPGESAWEGWIRWAAAADTQFSARIKDLVHKTRPDADWIVEAASLGVQAAATLFNVGGPVGNAGARPIGFVRDVTKDPAGRAFSFSPKVLFLNYDVAQLLVTSNPAGLGPGVLAISYTEDAYFRGAYALYLQVERVA